jgi:hypothetical protein
MQGAEWRREAQRAFTDLADGVTMGAMCTYKYQSSLRRRRQRLSAARSLRQQRCGRESGPENEVQAVRPVATGIVIPYFSSPARVSILAALLAAISSIGGSSFRDEERSLSSSSGDRNAIPDIGSTQTM